MNRFIKDNMMLLIVGGVSVLVSLTLLVLALLEHSAMFTYTKQANELREQISTLIKQKPAPVEGNLKPIQSDIDIYRKKAAEIKVSFSGVKQPALEGFARKLGMTLPDFRQRFRADWEADASRHAPGGRDRFYQRFKGRDEFAGKWDEAIAFFAEEYQKITIEPVTLANRDELLMTAMGVPRNMGNDSRRAFDYMWLMRRTLADMFSANKISMPGEAPCFSFNYNAPPMPETIANITRNWEIIGDIGQRMAKSGIVSLESFSHRLLEGERNGDYVIYHYTFEVTGPLEKIRGLVLTMHNAIQDNRFYIVRSVFLYADRDDAREVFRERERETEKLRLEAEAMARGDHGDKAAEEQPGQGRRPGPGGRRGAPPPQDASREPVRKVLSEEEIMKRPYYERPGYGRTLFGNDNGQRCRAVIDIEYIILAEPELN